MSRGGGDAGRVTQGRVTQADGADTPMHTIARMLSDVRSRTPGATAVAYRGGRLTFAELDQAARRAARALSELGVGRGDRVALWLPNCPAYLVLWLGAARLGAITVAVNTRFRAVEVADVLHRSGARALALWPGFRGIPFLDVLGEIDRSALERLETLVVYGEEEEGKAGEEADAAGAGSVGAAARTAGATGAAARMAAGTARALPDPLPASLAGCRRVAFPDLLERPPLDEDRAAPGDGANMFTTSGTTRAPKFVLHSHASVTAHAFTMARALGYAARPESGVLGMLPLCGVFGFCQTTAALAAGSPLALASAFDPAEAVRLVDEHRVRCLNVTDDMLMAMFDAAPREVAFPTVEACGFAAFAAKPDELLARAEARGLRLVGLYGMSEVQAFFSRQPLDAAPERRLLGGGVPIDLAGRVRVRDPGSGRLLAAGKAGKAGAASGAGAAGGGTGEIEIAGPSLMREYFENPAATRETITEDGFVRSGDLGYLTDDGGFVYLGRMGDAMRLGGFLVSPAEIEGHLNEHPAVRGAQVVGVDTEGGPRPVAFIVPDPGGGGFDEPALRGHCERSLARFKVPARIFAVDGFPTTKSANGTKIRRAELRRMAEERLVAGGAPFAAGAPRSA